MNSPSSSRVYPTTTTATSGRRRGGGRPREVVARIVVDGGPGEGGLQAVEDGHHVGRPHVAGAAVAQVAGGSQLADHRKPTEPVGLQRQERRAVHGFVAEQDHGLRRRLAGQGRWAGLARIDLGGAGAVRPGTPRTAAARPSCG